MANLSAFEESAIISESTSIAEIFMLEAYDMRLSIDVSIGFVFSDLRNDDRPGVKAIEVDGILDLQNDSCSSPDAITFT